MERSQLTRLDLLANGHLWEEGYTQPGDDALLDGLDAAEFKFHDREYACPCQLLVRLQGWLGILASFSGVAVISVEPGQGLSLSLSALLALAAVISQAVYSVMQKPFLSRYSPIQFTSYAIWSGTFFLLVFAPGTFRQFQEATLASTLAVIYMGIFPGRSATRAGPTCCPACQLLKPAASST